MERVRGRESEATAGYDLWLILAVAVLLVIGLWMVYSVTQFRTVAHIEDADNTWLANDFVRQLLFSVLGLILAAVVARVEYHFWRRLSVPILALTIVALIVVLVQGFQQNGATSWITKSGSIQPSEAAKLAMIIYVAHWLSSKGDRIRQLTYGLGPFTFILAVVIGLILGQKDFGTAVLITVTALSMFFVAGGAIKQLLAVAVVACSAAVVAVATVAYRLERVISFWTFDVTHFTPADTLDQIKQGLIALSLGGVFGRGLGDSVQKFGYIPAAHTDSIFAVLGEEVGLIGCLAVLGLFSAIAYRGFTIALRSRDQYGTLLAAGITFGLLFQAIVNVGGVTATIPATGVPLPFISYGGSSLVVSLVSVGLLLSVSRQTLPEAEPEEVPGSVEQESRSFDEDHDIRRRNGGARVPRPGRRRVANNRTAAPGQWPVEG